MKLQAGVLAFQADAVKLCLQLVEVKGNILTEDQEGVSHVDSVDADLRKGIPGKRI